MSTAEKADPNLTPLLDIVFQLITFFMLVINFSNENYDQRIKLPVAGSARPMEDSGDKAVSDDRLVVNVTKGGHMLVTGKELLPHQAMAEIKHQADLVRLNMRASGIKPDANGALPTTIILRADRDTPFSSLYQLINACQSHGFYKFALKAMSGT